MAYMIKGAVAFTCDSPFLNENLLKIPFIFNGFLAGE